MPSFANAVLKDLCSAKFLKILTGPLSSRLAYVFYAEADDDHTNSLPCPKAVFENLGNW